MKCEGYPNYPSGYNLITKILKRGRQEGQGDAMMEAEEGRNDVIAGFEDRGRGQREGRCLYHLVKAKKTALLPRADQMRCQPSETDFILLSSQSLGMNLHCFNKSDCKGVLQTSQETQRQPCSQPRRRQTLRGLSPSKLLSVACPRGICLRSQPYLRPHILWFNHPCLVGFHQLFPDTPHPSSL